MLASVCLNPIPVVYLRLTFDTDLNSKAANVGFLSDPLVKILNARQSVPASLPMIKLLFYDDRVRVWRREDARPVIMC